MRAFEAEEIKKTGKDLDKVVVGEIVEIKKHPNADKLQVVKVDIKNKKLNIVCGACNIAIGQKVPVALAGAKLPGGLEIKKAEIRGVKSYGMLCAEDELGLGSDHSGILILDEKLKTGMNLAEALKLDDAVIDLDILSNRGHDALSHIGIAREIRALENRNCEWPRMGKQINANGRMRIDANANGNLIDVDIEDEKLCPRYIGAVIKNIKIKESPSWIKSRLITCGINPVNNVVDAANYVMLELGQPLHCFDFGKIKTMEIPNPKSQIPNKIQSPKSKVPSIFIRNAKKGEKIKLLDGTVAELIANDLVIADSEKALAVAGIMGGLDSGVNPKTKNIFLEAANFNPMSIRKTRMRLGIKTESSDRFERELDPNLAEKGMARLIEIISETAGGKLESVKDIYPKKVLPWKIKLDLAYLNRLLGEDISPKIVKKILENLELRVTSYKLQAASRKPRGQARRRADPSDARLHRRARQNTTLATRCSVSQVAADPGDQPCQDSRGFGLRREQFGDRIAVPQQQKFIGFDAYRKAIDCLGPMTSCVLGLPECSDAAPCPLHTQWKDIRDRIVDMLGKQHLAGFVRELRDRM